MLLVWNFYSNVLKKFNRIYIDQHNYRGGDNKNRKIKKWVENLNRMDPKWVWFKREEFTFLTSPINICGFC